MKSKAIADQYKADLFHYRATYNGHLDYDQILNRINIYEKREEFKRKCALRKENRRILALLLKIISSNLFNFHEKLQLIKLLIKSILK
jgi:hypothetical protein